MLLIPLCDYVAFTFQWCVRNYVAFRWDYPCLAQLQHNIIAIMLCSENGTVLTRFLYIFHTFHSIKTQKGQQIFPLSDLDDFRGQLRCRSPFWKSASRPLPQRWSAGLVWTVSSVSDIQAVLRSSNIHTGSHLDDNTPNICGINVYNTPSSVWRWNQSPCW